jgi:hypothetical protein
MAALPSGFLPAPRFCFAVFILPERALQTSGCYLVGVGARFKQRLLFLSAFYGFLVK